MLIPFDKASKERGFAPVATELLMKLASCPDITARQYRIIMLVIRKTYGYKEGNTNDEQLRKKYDWIAKKQLIDGLEYIGQGGHLLADIRALLSRKILREIQLKKPFRGIYKPERCVGINPYLNQWLTKKGVKYPLTTFLTEDEQVLEASENGCKSIQNRSQLNPKMDELEAKESCKTSENGCNCIRNRAQLNPISDTTREKIKDKDKASGGAVFTEIRMYQNWMPLESIVQLLQAKKIKEQFISDQVDEFRGYWIKKDKSLTDDEWDKKFNDRCITEWQLKGHLYKDDMNSAEARNKRLTDISWA